MKVCIPTTDDNGWEAHVFPHFGRAPFFAMVDTESSQIEFIPNRGRHAGGGQPPAMVIAELGPDAVVCSGMGYRAVALLQERGIRVLSGTEESIKETVERLQAGELQEATQDWACRGHEH